MTQEQNEQIFELMRRKLEREITAVYAEAELKRELMEKKVGRPNSSQRRLSYRRRLCRHGRSTPEEKNVGRGRYFRYDPPRSQENYPPFFRFATRGDREDFSEQAQADQSVLPVLNPFRLENTIGNIVIRKIRNTAGPER